MLDILTPGPYQLYLLNLKETSQRDGTGYHLHTNEYHVWLLKPYYCPVRQVYLVGGGDYSLLSDSIIDQDIHQSFINIILFKMIATLRVYNFQKYNILRLD